MTNRMICIAPHTPSTPAFEILASYKPEALYGADVIVPYTHTHTQGAGFGFLSVPVTLVSLSDSVKEQAATCIHEKVKIGSSSAVKP